MGRKAKEIIEYRTYDLVPDFPVLLLDGDEWVISDVLSERQHFHNCLEIGLCHSDGGMLYYGREALPFQAGDISIIAHHVPHTTCSAKGTRSRWSYLFVDADRMLGGLQGESEKHEAALLEPHLLINSATSPRLYFLITEMMTELHGSRKDKCIAVQSLFYLLFRDLIYHSDGKREISRHNNTFSLRPALDHIHDNYTQPITIGELAEMCHLSSTHFRRTFTTIVGMAPLGFLNATRVNHACELLLTTNESILSISEKVGFGSLSSFNRCFSQTTGVSPRAYRSPNTVKDALPRGEHVLTHAGWLKPDAQPEFHRREDDERA